MIRLPQWSICAVLLTGCASLPGPPAPEPDVPSDAPWGLAWISPSGEVAIKAGAVEHVLYPEATKQKPASTLPIPTVSAELLFRKSVVSSHHAGHPAARVKSEAARRQCALGE